MGDLLSQAEIEALLNGQALPDSPGAQDDAGFPGDAAADDGAFTGLDEDAEAGFTDESDSSGDDSEFIFGDDPSGDFTEMEIDALGEIGNISMGNSATTLYSLLSKKVAITTPRVTVSTLKKIAATYKAPLVVVKVEYTEGILGSNLLVLKESDVMVITDLMLGGDGTNVQGELSDLHLSAISEAMNQMIGNASTSLSNVFDRKIDISPPNAVSVKINDGRSLLHVINIEPNEKVAVVSFHMTAEDLLDTRIMQILPLSFAKDMIGKLMGTQMQNAGAPAQAQQPQPPAPVPAPPQEYAAQPQQPQYAPPPQYAQPQQPQYAPPPQYAQPPQHTPPPQYAQQQYVNVQPANFQAFEEEPIMIDKKNIGLVMDVSLEVSVELGRTRKLIREILEFGQGTIIELDKLAGEPVDILVNGRIIAKGEVVVIDESFGVRVTDIIHPSKRI